MQCVQILKNIPPTLLRCARYTCHTLHTAFTHVFAMVSYAFALFLLCFAAFFLLVKFGPRVSPRRFWYVFGMFCYEIAMCWLCCPNVFPCFALFSYVFYVFGMFCHVFAMVCFVFGMVSYVFASG